MKRALTLVLTGVSMCGCASTPSAHRSLDSVQQWSSRMVAHQGMERMSGLDPVDDWALLLWTQRAFDDPETYPGHVPLFVHMQETIDVAMARTLVEFDGDALFFCDLRSLDAESAAVLASGPHELFFDALTELSPATARALVDGGTRRLSLKGITQLDVETAQVLAELDGSLHLDGLARADLATVRALAEWRGWGEQVILHLGLTDPTVEQIETLATCEGWGIALDQITALNPERAAALGTIVRPYLSLNGILEMTTATARVIGQWRAKFLVLNGLERADAEQRALLEQGCEALSMRSLPELD
tara:strand:- start:39866 stop:40774 length:909 start_codon:yes stop_codon:yes gene_type:complete